MGAGASTFNENALVLINDLHAKILMLAKTCQTTRATCDVALQSKLHNTLVTLQSTIEFLKKNAVEHQTEERWLRGMETAMRIFKHNPPELAYMDESVYERMLLHTNVMGLTNEENIDVFEIGFLHGERLATYAYLANSELTPL